ncbi:MAG TPA: type II toxin-antitoxin system Phd/YefM family antitoxin [Bacteroidetes bacterium]|nr:type II toxin-antitoxin system Phd/YefM family antitoxin [Bacteroidota bacterium]
MQTVTFTEFRRRASEFIARVQRGERFVLVRRGKPVAEIVPLSERPSEMPSWKRPGPHLRLSGSDLSSAILEERENSS